MSTNSLLAIARAAFKPRKGMTPDVSALGTRSVSTQASKLPKDQFSSSVKESKTGIEKTVQGSQGFPAKALEKTGNLLRGTEFSLTPVLSGFSKTLRETRTLDDEALEVKKAAEITRNKKREAIRAEVKSRTQQLEEKQKIHQAKTSAILDELQAAQKSQSSAGFENTANKLHLLKRDGAVMRSEQAKLRVEGDSLFLQAQHADRRAALGLDG